MKWRQIITNKQAASIDLWLLPGGTSGRRFAKQIENNRTAQRFPPRSPSRSFSQIPTLLRGQSQKPSALDHNIKRKKDVLDNFWWCLCGKLYTLQFLCEAWALTINYYDSNGGGMFPSVEESWAMKPPILYEEWTPFSMMALQSFQQRFLCGRMHTGTLSGSPRVLMLSAPVARPAWWRPANFSHFLSFLKAFLTLRKNCICNVPVLLKDVG